MTWFLIAVVFGLCVPFLMRANEVFVLSVRDGRSLLMRGRIPITLRQEIDDVLARARVTSATLRVVRSGGVARMIAHGVDADVAQRLRNVLGIVSDHKLRAAPPPGPRNLGQRLGIAWLAWRLREQARRAR